MTANDLSKKFLIWFQNEYPDARIYRNNSGAVRRKNGMIHFGIPNRGGADFIAFVPKVIQKYIELANLDNSTKLLKGHFIENSILTVEFYEIKTKNDRMSKEQINFADMITKMGGKYFIVHELKAEIKQKNKWQDMSNFYIEKWEIKE